jgi:hypothetical protein
MADVNDSVPANDNSESGNDEINDPAGETDSLMAAISSIASGADSKEPEVKKEEVKVVESAAAKVESEQ